MDFLASKVEYHHLHVLLKGTDNPNTIIDDRPGINFDENTRARFFDFPVQFRYYNKDRHEEGHRLFVQFGPTLRLIRKVKTNIVVDETGEERRIDETPAAFRRKLYGVTAGGGFQFIDPFGIRVVPEARYTRWFGNPIDNYHSRSRRDQIEIILSLTF
jgi:hypothetical protein